MTVDRLGPVDPVAKFNKTQKSSRTEKQSPADSINVSEEARRNAELYKIAEAVKATPDIRMDRVEEVRAKLQDPNYLDSAVDDVAGKIIDIFGI